MSNAVTIKSICFLSKHNFLELDIDSYQIQENF